MIHSTIFYFISLMFAFLLVGALILLVLKLGVAYSLDILNLKNVSRCAGSIPQGMEEVMSEESYQKSILYTQSQTRFGYWERAYEASILALLISTSILATIYEAISSLVGFSTWGQATGLFLIGLLLSIPSIPFDWWRQFRIEESFGFNKSTVRLWIVDKLKGLVLGFAIGLPLLWLLIKAFDWLGTYWWIWAFGGLFVFQLVMMVIYPIWIMPWFNRFEDLPEGDLRNRLQALADRIGFRAKTIQVMDGSKRSGHSNAFFTGFGKFRRIVLFDTLIEQLEPEQLEAVLAHEIGHYRCGHVPKMLAVSALGSFLMFAVLGFLSNQPAFVQAFGFSGTTGIVPVLLVFSLLSGLVTFWLTPLGSLFSRKHEFEADAFAFRAQNCANPLIGALHQLSEKNLSNLTPHRWYSRFYYSHPTLLERQKALFALEETT